MKRKARVEIRHRAVEECYRLFPEESDRSIARRLGCNHKSIPYWRDGGTPDPMYLVRLHHLGADVIYILTGERIYDLQEKDN